MPERHYREERDRGHGSEDRRRQVGRREESPSERRNYYSRDRDRRDRSDRYWDSRRGYDRYDEGRPSYYGREGRHHRRSDRDHGNPHDEDRSADDDHRPSRNGHRGEEVEATGSSEMQRRRRRQNGDDRNSPEPRHNNLKRERSEECESEAAKRRRSSRDMPCSVRRYDHGSDGEDDARSRMDDRRDFDRQAIHQYDQYSRGDTRRNAPPNRRYSRDDEDVQIDYDRGRDRTYGRRSREEFERGGDEEQSTRAPKRPANDVSLPQEERTGRRRGSPHEAMVEDAPNRETRTDDNQDRRHRHESDHTAVDNIRRRENFSQGNVTGNIDTRFNEIRNSRPMRSGHGEPRRGFGDHERNNQAPRDSRSGFIPRGRGDQAQDEYRRRFGARERDNQRFRGGRPGEGAQIDRRQFNRFDTPRPGRGQNFGGQRRGGFQQGNPYEVDIPTIVKEVPIDENLVYDEKIFRFGFVVYQAEVWDEGVPNQEIPEAYKRVEIEMRKNGEYVSTTDMETDNEEQSQIAQKSTKPSVSTGANDDEMRNVNANENGTNVVEESSDCNAGVGTEAMNDEKTNETVNEVSNERSKENSNSNAEAGERSDEVTDEGKNGREDEKIHRRETQGGGPNEEMDACTAGEEERNGNSGSCANANVNEEKNADGKGNVSMSEEDQGTETKNDEMQVTIHSEPNSKKEVGQETNNEKDGITTDTMSDEAPASGLPQNQSSARARERLQERNKAGKGIKKCSPVNVIVEKNEKE